MATFITNDEQLIIKAAISKLEIQSIVPPLTPNEQQSPKLVKEHQIKMDALHSLCEKVMH